MLTARTLSMMTVVIIEATLAILAGLLAAVVFIAAAGEPAGPAMWKTLGMGVLPAAVAANVLAHTFLGHLWRKERPPEPGPSALDGIEPYAGISVPVDTAGMETTCINLRAAAERWPQVAAHLPEVLREMVSRPRVRGDNLMLALWAAADQEAWAEGLRERWRFLLYADGCPEEELEKLAAACHAEGSFEPWFRWCVAAWADVEDDEIGDEGEDDCTDENAATAKSRGQMH